jgi:adenylate cyclase
MGIEIERKFLPKGDGWRGAIKGAGVRIRQGYLAGGKLCTMRVRMKGEGAWIAVKGMRRGATRAEYEYPIPPEDAGAMLEGLCEKPLIEKTRYLAPVGGVVFEIDEFYGENAGLVLIEVELEREDQAVDLPEWVGEEVTEDGRYYNSNLARHPFSDWGRPG